MKIIKSIATLFTGSLGSQIVVVLMMPFLARYYPASAFGDWALFVALSTALAVISAFRYDLSVLLPASAGHALKLVKSAVTISVLASCCAMTMITILYFFGIVEKAIYLLVPASMMLTSLIQVATTWSNRRKSYKLIAFAKLAQSLSTATLNILFVVLYTSDLDAVTLISATVIGQFIGLAWVAWPAIKNVRKTFLLFRRVRQSKSLLLKYGDFPLYSMPEALLGTVSTMFPLYASGYFFTSHEAGYVALAHRVLMLPVALIGGAVSVVYAQKFAVMVARSQQITADMLRVWLTAAFIGIFPALILNIFGEELFIFAFGEQWQKSGEIASALSFYVYLLLMFSLTSGAHVALRLQHVSLIIAIIAFIGKCLVAYWLQEDLLPMMIAFVAMDLGATFIMNLLALFRSVRLKNESLNAT